MYLKNKVSPWYLNFENKLTYCYSCKWIKLKKEENKKNQLTIVQVAVGTGKALNGTLMVNSSPANTVISRIAKAASILGGPVEKKIKIDFKTNHKLS